MAHGNRTARKVGRSKTFMTGDDPYTGERVAFAARHAHLYKNVGKTRYRSLDAAKVAAAKTSLLRHHAWGDKRKKDMSTRAFLARRARGVRTRVGSRYRNPRNGQFV